MTMDRNSKRPQARLGRPPKDLAGDVKSRILDAAQQVFLKRGYQSASVDEIAEMAPASKPTIYAHFDGKEALFEAVIARIITGLTNFEGYEPRGRTVTDKLTSVGTELVERFLEDTVGVTRATIAEADRFPALSRHVHEAGRDRAASCGFACPEQCGLHASARCKGAFRYQAKPRHRADFHGPHSAPNADASSDGRGRETPSKGGARFRARTRQLFSGSL